MTASGNLPTCAGCHRSAVTHERDEGPTLTANPHPSDWDLLVEVRSFRLAFTEEAAWTAPFGSTQIRAQIIVRRSYAPLVHIPRAEHLRTILAGLRLAGAKLAPLREVREREYGEPLPDVAFPVTAYSTEELSRADAWEVFRELRNDERLADFAVTVTTSDAEELANFWENVCPDVTEKLALRAATEAPTEAELAGRARAWGKSPAARRTSQKRGRVSPAHASSVSWSTSLRAPYASHDRQKVYVLDVEPWASPLALGWLLTNDRWRAVVPLLRRWHEAHGFEVVALGPDLLEAWVPRPPDDASTIVDRLAESVTFCSGYLDEGFAVRLQMVMGPVWQFRFDI